MAVFISDSDHNLSAGGAAWKRSEEYALPGWVLSTNVLFTTRYQVLAFANNCNLDGVIVGLSYETGDRDVKVALEEETAPGVWTERVSVTRTVAEINTYGVDRMRHFLVPFLFAAPYAVTTAANTWRLAVVQTGGASGSWQVWYTDAGKTQMVRVCVNDFQTGKPGASDCAVLKNIITMDEDWTLGNAETVTGATWSMMVVNDGKFTLENPPSAAYTLTMTGLLSAQGNGQFEAGTPGSRIPVSEQFIIQFNDPGAGKNYGFYDWGSSSYAEGYGEVRLYGERPTTPFTLLTTKANSGQAQLVVDDDVSALWTVGKTVDVLGGAVASFACVEHMVIQGIVGTTITLTGNLTYAHEAGHPVIYRDSDIYGIKVAWGATGGGTRRLEMWGKREIVFDGVYFTVPSASKFSSRFAQYDYTTCDRIFRYCFFESIMLLFQYPSGIYSNTIDHVCLFSDGQSGGLYLQTSASNITASDSCFYDATNYPLYVEAVNVSLTDCYFEGSTVSISYAIAYFINALKLTMVDCKLHGGPRNIFTQLSEGLFHNLTMDWIGYYGFDLYQVVNLDVTGLNFNPNGGGGEPIRFNPAGYISGTCIDTPTGFASITTTGLTSCIEGTLLNIHAFGGAGSNDHRNYGAMGIIQSVGDGLPDTTVHIAGASCFALRFETIDDSEEFAWSFAVPTGDIQGQTMTVGVWCKINSANYWSGTHVMPRLTVDYDNGTEVYAEAAQTTDWQLLAMTFTPATAYGQITVKLSTKTDQAGANSYVYFDDMAVLYPAGYSLDLGGMDLWARGLPVVPPIATVISARDVWTIMASQLTGAGTIGQLLNAAVGGQYHFDKSTGVETIKDSGGNAVVTRTVTDTDTEVEKA